MQSLVDNLLLLCCSPLDPSLLPLCWLACKVTPANHISFRFHLAEKKKQCKREETRWAVYKQISVGFLYHCVTLQCFTV